MSGLVALLAVGALGACTPKQVEAYLTVTEPHREVLTAGQLSQLRTCESTDNYAAIGGGGAYRGAYQFNRQTWNGVARRHYPWLVRVDPARAEPWWQDAMARALWSESGRSPWPHCGRQVTA